MTFHAPALTPETGFYALIAVAVVVGLFWLFERARQDKPKPAKDEDPIERQFKEIK